MVRASAEEPHMPGLAFHGGIRLSRPKSAGAPGPQSGQPYASLYMKEHH